MLTIIIFKWIFIFSTIVLSVYHYVLEREKLNTLSKYVTDSKVISQLKASARTRMTQFFFLFAAFIIWIMSYDLEIESVNKEKTELANELQNASKTYANSNDSQKRLVQAKVPDQNLIDDTKTYYTDVFVNYYVMRKCALTSPDDAFIINSAMTREIGLNNISLSLRDQIIKDSKTAYLKKFSDIDCGQIHNKYQDIITNYRNYIATVREVLRATF